MKPEPLKLEDLEVRRTPGPALAVLEAHTPDTNWDDNSMLAICTGFIDSLPDELRLRFQAVVDERAAFEAGESEELG